MSKYFYIILILLMQNYSLLSHEIRLPLLKDQISDNQNIEFLFNEYSKKKTSIEEKEHLLSMAMSLFQKRVMSTIGPDDIKKFESIFNLGEMNSTSKARVHASKFFQGLSTCKRLDLNFNDKIKSNHNPHLCSLQAELSNIFSNVDFTVFLLKFDAPSDDDCDINKINELMKYYQECNSRYLDGPESLTAYCQNNKVTDLGSFNYNNSNEIKNFITKQTVEKLDQYFGSEGPFYKIFAKKVQLLERHIKGNDDNLSFLKSQNSLHSKKYKNLKNESNKIKKPIQKAFDSYTKISAKVNKEVSILENRFKNMISTEYTKELNDINSQLDKLILQMNDKETDFLLLSELNTDVNSLNSQKDIDIYKLCKTYYCQMIGYSNYFKGRSADAPLQFRVKCVEEYNSNPGKYPLQNALCKGSFLVKNGNKTTRIDIKRYCEKHTNGNFHKYWNKDIGQNLDDIKKCLKAKP